MILNKHTPHSSEEEDSRLSEKTGEDASSFQFQTNDEESSREAD